MYAKNQKISTSASEEKTNRQNGHRISHRTVT